MFFFVCLVNESFFNLINILSKKKIIFIHHTFLEPVCLNTAHQKTGSHSPPAVCTHSKILPGLQDRGLGTHLFCLDAFTFLTLSRQRWPSFQPGNYNDQWSCFGVTTTVTKRAAELRMTKWIWNQRVWWQTYMYQPVGPVMHFKKSRHFWSNSLCPFAVTIQTETEGGIYPTATG